MGLGPTAGELSLGDIAISRVVYDRLDITYLSPFGSKYVVPIKGVSSSERPIRSEGGT